MHNCIAVVYMQSKYWPRHQEFPKSIEVSSILCGAYHSQHIFAACVSECFIVAVFTISCRYSYVCAQCGLIFAFSQSFHSFIIRHYSLFFVQFRVPLAICNNSSFIRSFFAITKLDPKSSKYGQRPDRHALFIHHSLVLIYSHKYHPKNVYSWQFNFPVFFIMETIHPKKESNARTCVRACVFVCVYWPQQFMWTWNVSAKKLHRSHAHEKEAVLINNAILRTKNTQSNSMR